MQGGGEALINSEFGMRNSELCKVLPVGYVQVSPFTDFTD